MGDERYIMNKHEKGEKKGKIKPTKKGERDGRDDKVIIHELDFHPPLSSHITIVVVRLGGS